MKIESVASHRNGVGGQPFVVAIIHDHWDQEHRFLVTIAWDDRDPDVERLDEATCRVLDLDMAANGNIAFTENSWRGDVLGEQWADAIKAALTEHREALLASLIERSNDE